MNRRGSAGFTLVEMALTLTVLGLLAAVAAAAYLGIFSAQRTRVQADASLSVLAAASMNFAQTHHRLPCPDRAGQGFEDLQAGVCAQDARVGWFPYQTLGLPLPAPGARVMYGVYRAAGADLARAVENSGDPVGAASYADGADFLRALAAAAAQAPSAQQIYLTGDGAASGAENCAGNVVSNPAFVLLAPGEARDGDGQTLDGVHRALLPLPTTSLCFAAPTRAQDTHFDDRTQAISFYVLIAKLNNSL